MVKPNSKEPYLVLVVGISLIIVATVSAILGSGHSDIFEFILYIAGPIGLILTLHFPIIHYNSKKAIDEYRNFAEGDATKSINWLAEKIDSLEEGEKDVSYDSRCFDLARVFIADINGASLADCEELAQAIQDVIEDHCQEVEERVAKMERAP